MSVDKQRRDQFSREDPARIHRHLKEYLSFVLTNVKYLRNQDPDGKHEKAAREFKEMLDRGETLSDGQRSYAENIYELTMKGYGLPSVDRHRDKPKPTLRFNKMK